MQRLSGDLSSVFPMFCQPTWGWCQVIATWKAGVSPQLVIVPAERQIPPKGASTLFRYQHWQKMASLCESLFPSSNHRGNLKNCLSVTSHLCVAGIISSLMPLSQHGYSALSGCSYYLESTWVQRSLWTQLLTVSVSVLTFSWKIMGASAEDALGLGETAACSRAVGTLWMKRVEKCNSKGDLFRSWEESEYFFLITMAEK